MRESVRKVEEIFKEYLRDLKVNEPNDYVVEAKFILIENLEELKNEYMSLTLIFSCNVPS